MFSYNENYKEKELHITISSQIRFTFDFMNEITKLMKKVENSKCENVYISNKKIFRHDKLGLAYLYNTILYLAKHKKLLVDKKLYTLFHEKISLNDGESFKKIDIKETSLSKIQQCYTIHDDKSVNHIVQTTVEFISDKNLVFENAKEFLVTTIGEIFTNAFGHSNEKTVIFMYDIETKNNKFCLVINITDYGKTIVHNVQNFQEQNGIEKMKGADCVRWAMKVGNTTRLGSGGYGLPTLVSYVRNIRGELLIFSGNVLYALKGDRENIFNSKGEFYGTSISMKIPLFDTKKVLTYDEKMDEIISIDLEEI